MPRVYPEPAIALENEDFNKNNRLYGRLDTGYCTILFVLILCINLRCGV